MSMLTAEARAEVNRRLCEAERVLHDLMLGKKTVSVSYDGKAVTYNQTDIGRLRAYIVELKGQLGIRRRPPMKPFFL